MSFVWARGQHQSVDMKCMAFAQQMGHASFTCAASFTFPKQQV
jgi:hypothetical protein